MAGRVDVGPNACRVRGHQCFLGLEIFFLGLPGWFIATALYVGLSLAQQRAGTRRTLAEGP